MSYPSYSYHIYELTQSSGFHISKYTHIKSKHAQQKTVLFLMKFP